MRDAILSDTVDVHQFSRGDPIIDINIKIAKYKNEICETVIGCIQEYFGLLDVYHISISNQHYV